MTSRVLLADDSATIQKVIKITLANESYEITIADHESNLITKVKETHPQIVLLDFGLSESLSGYDLCREIKQVAPKTRVLMMYGTFDSVDEGALRSAGASDKVIKPFDSAKFVTICKSLIEEYELDHTDVSQLESLDDQNETQEFTPIQYVDEDRTQEICVDALDDEETIESNEDNGTIDADKNLDVQRASLRVLSSDEINDWYGISVPGVIGNDETTNDVLEDFPPVIEDSNEVLFDEEKFVVEDPFADADDGPILGGSMMAQEDKTQEIDLSILNEDTILPESDDLAFPDDLMDFNDDEEKDENPLAKLTPLSSLNRIEDEKKISPMIQPKIDENDDALLAMLDDDDDDLWKIDEPISKPKDVVPNTVSIGTSSIVEESSLLEEEVFTEVDPFASLAQETLSQATSSSSINIADIEEQVKSAIEPIVQKYVEKYCKDAIEKIAWDVIPDLAENLIQKELKKIADQVMND